MTKTRLSPARSSCFKLAGKPGARRRAAAPGSPELRCYCGLEEVRQHLGVPAGGGVVEGGLALRIRVESEACANQTNPRGSSVASGDARPAGQD